MRTIIILTITNPESGRSCQERTANPYRAEEYAINMTRRGYHVTQKIGRARKHEISVEEYRDGKRYQTIDY